MNDLRELESYARECIRLAWHTNDAMLRDQLLKLAREWMALSMAEEAGSDAGRPAQPLRVAEYGAYLDCRERDGHFSRRDLRQPANRRDERGATLPVLSD